VLDYGAYVGGFGLATLTAGAGHLHFVEPAPDNQTALSENIKCWPNTTIHACGLYQTDGHTHLNIAGSGVEHSFTQPYDNQVLGQIEVQTRRIDTLSKELDGSLDFIKIEADGVEKEIVNGIGDVRAKKIAIDVSPERDGESPNFVISTQLRKIGYQLHQRGHVLFGWLKTPRPRRRANQDQPKTLYTIWHGKDMPRMAKICLRCWQSLYPDHTINLVDAEHSRKIHSHLGLDYTKISIQAQSDIVRHWLLLRHGGVWIDATIFSIKPLDHFVADYQD